MATPKNRGWLWYFIVLGVLTVAATTILAVFNLRQQLTPEQLEQARKAWQEHGPADYSFSYTVKRDDVGGGSTDHFFVKVRGGRPVEVLDNGRPLEPGQLVYHSMPRLFDDIERFLDLDAEKGKPKTFVRAFFNLKNGALQRYVRRVMGTRQRLEIIVDSFEAK